MPPIRVKVPGVGIVEFPEGTSTDEMQDVLSKPQRFVPEESVKQKQQPLRRKESSRLAIDPMGHIPMGVEDIPQTPSPEQLRAVGAVGLPTLGGIGGAALGTLLGGPGGTVIGESLGAGGGEALSQLLGFSEPSLGQIGLAAGAGPIARTTLGMAKGALRGLGSITMPQQFRLAGTELLEGIFRGPESRRLFEIARKAGNVPTKTIVGSLDDAIKAEASLSTPNQKALRLLGNLRQKLSATGANSYDDLINEAQRLNQEAGKAFARGDNVAGSTISKAHKTILDEMDKINPAIKSANAAYRREQNIIKLSDLLSKGNPSAELRKLIRHDALFGEGFSQQELKTMTDLVDRLGRMPGQALGLGRAAVQGATETVAEAFANPFVRKNFLEPLVKRPGRPAVLWSAAIQAARAGLILAQEEQLSVQVGP